MLNVNRKIKKNQKRAIKNGKKEAGLHFVLIPITSFGTHSTHTLKKDDESIQWANWKKRIETISFFSALNCSLSYFYCSSFSSILLSLAVCLPTMLIDSCLHKIRNKKEHKETNFSVKWFRTIIRIILKNHYNCTTFLQCFPKEKNYNFLAASLWSDFHGAEKKRAYFPAYGGWCIECDVQMLND